MLLEVVRRWWVFLVRGVLAVLFGILAFIMPTVTLFSLVFLFGFYALIDGIARIIDIGTTRTMGRTA
jgi:uncharacterized membrane protein HdeD (DUF308 family)